MRQGLKRCSGGSPTGPRSNLIQLCRNSTDSVEGSYGVPIMSSPSRTDAVDRECMTRAIASATRVRCITSPNPWVGAMIRTKDGQMFEGATLEPGQAHAEVVALNAAGERALGSTLYVTLEPCSHTGRTGPCVDAIIAAGVSRVVVAIEDPDPESRG